MLHTVAAYAKALIYVFGVLVLFLFGQGLGLFLSAWLSFMDGGTMLVLVTTTSALTAGLFACFYGDLRRWFVRPPKGAVLCQGLLAWGLFAILVQVLGGYFDQSPMDFMDGIITASNRWWVWFAVVVVAPIGEELIFRGLIFERLSAINTATATVISSVLFTLVHLQYNWFGLVAIFVLALLLCYVRVRSGGLLLPIAIHSLNNAVAMGLYCLGYA